MGEALADDLSRALRERCHFPCGRYRGLSDEDRGLYDKDLGLCLEFGHLNSVEEPSLPQGPRVLHFPLDIFSLLL